MTRTQTPLLSAHGIMTSAGSRIQYSIVDERDGYKALTVFEGRRCASLRLSPAMQKQLCRLLTRPWPKRRKLAGEK